MGDISCGAVLSAYSQDLSMLDVAKPTVSNGGVGFASRRIIDTPNNRAMIDGLRADKPAGLEIEVKYSIDTYSTPDSETWNKFTAAVEAKGAKRENGGMGWVSFSADSNSTALAIVSDLQATTPPWIKVTVNDNKINILNQTPVIDVDLHVEGKCQ